MSFIVKCFHSEVELPDSVCSQLQHNRAVAVFQGSHSFSDFILKSSNRIIKRDFPGKLLLNYVCLFFKEVYGGLSHELLNDKFFPTRQIVCINSIQSIGRCKYGGQITEHTTVFFSFVNQLE